MNKDMSITVGVPTTGMIHHKTLESLIEVTGSGLIQAVNIVPRLPIQQARTRIVQTTRTSHLLFADDDMVFTANDLQKLIDVMPEKGVVCGLAVTRSEKSHPVVSCYDREKDSYFVNTDFDDKLPSKIDAGTLAFTLIDMKVFDVIGAQFYFEVGRGEDTNFFDSCRIAGIPVLLQPKARIGHITTKVLTYGNDNL